MDFAEALQHYQRWQRKNLPGIDTPQGMTLLIWLLESEYQPRAIGQLYKASRASEPTMRAAVKLFVDFGLATFELDASDSRRRLLGGTPKLRQVMQEYRKQLAWLAEQA